MTSPLNSTAVAVAPERLPLTRTSEVLRGILTKNPNLKNFTVERILASIGEDRFEASMMMFSIPSIVPVPRDRGASVLPTGVIASQVARGHKTIELPRFIRRKTISRRALAVAIHAIVPVLEAAEKVVKPRWKWVNNGVSRRVLGLFVFLMTLAIGFPMLGFNPLHATSIFVVSLGMAEKDGLAVMIGLTVGVLSLVIFAASGLSLKALRSQFAKWLRKIARKLGLNVFANFLERVGYKWLSAIMSFEWSDLLLMWDPERREAEKTKRKAAAQTAGAAPRARRQIAGRTSPNKASVPALPKRRKAALVSA